MKDINDLGSITNELINIKDIKGLDYWSDKFDVTRAKLKAAVNAVGTSTTIVEAYLNKKKR